MKIKVATGCPGGTFCMFSIFQVGCFVVLSVTVLQDFYAPTHQSLETTNRPKKKAPTSRRMQSRSVAVRSKNPRSVGSLAGENDCEIPGSTFGVSKGG